MWKVVINLIVFGMQSLKPHHCVLSSKLSKS